LYRQDVVQRIVVNRLTALMAEFWAACRSTASAIT
jgi:hypothetical protein